MKFNLSLKAKLTAIAVLLFVAAIWAVAYYTAGVMRQDMERLLSEQQSSTVRYMARQVDRDITDRLQALGLIGRQITPDMLRDPLRLQRFLASNPLLDRLFAGGTIVFSEAGIALADQPALPGRKGTDYGFRDYIKAVQATRKPYVGKPVIGKHWKRPIMNLSVPLLGPQGELIGMIHGVSFLDELGFMGEIAKSRYGQEGRYSVISPRDEMYVISSDPKLVLQPLLPPGKDELLDRFRHGGEDSGIARGAPGEEELVSAAKVPSTGWLVVAELPAREAFQPVQHAVRRIYLAALAASLLVMGVVWLAMRYFLSPLGEAAEKLHRMTVGEMTLQPVEVRRDDEIGALLASFNLLQARVSDLIEFNQKIVGAASVGIAVFDSRGQCVMVNDGLINIIGGTREAILQRGFRQLESWRKSGLLEAAEEVLATGRDQQMDVHLTTTYGREVWLACYLSRFHRQEEPHLLQVALDISDRKRVEDALLRMNESLEKRVDEAVRKNLEQERMLALQSRHAAMGEMIGNIAHQWRQPLNSLNMVMANIKDDFDYHELTPEGLQHYVDQAKRLTRRMSDTIEDFRNFFRPAKEKSAFSLKQALDDTLSLLGAALRSHEIDLTVEEDAKEVNAYGYPNEYAQVLVNILNNAKDAIVARKVAGGTIHVRIGREDGKAVMTIRDNGGGIPEDVLPKLGGPYVTTKEGGTGIGLYMSKQIIETNMGGQLTLRNVEGGTECAIVCPVAE
ncbi:MAG: ATP-binding protein [Sulfuricellaceae bacterium]